MATRTKIGLYFGSFNPIHIGHTAIANYIKAYSDLDELWFVVTPQNPLKEKKTLLADYIRLELVQLAIGDYDGFKVSDIEFRLEKPSFTIDTLIYLEEKFPTREFVLIIGGDNTTSFNKWKNHEQLLNNYKIIVYTRPGWDCGEFGNHPNVTLLNAPQIEISSSFIRKAVASKHDVRFFMNPEVWRLIDKMNYYR